MSDSRPTVAQAMARAEKALDRIEAHEDKCDLRYKDIDKRLSTILAVLTWGGALALTTILGLLGWSLGQQFTANMQARAEMAAKIEALQAQVYAKDAAPAAKQ